MNGWTDGGREAGMNCQTDRERKGGREGGEGE